MRGTLIRVITIWAILIAIYLLVNNYIGATSLLQTADQGAVSITSTLQGR